MQDKRMTAAGKVNPRVTQVWAFKLGGLIAKLVDHDAKRSGGSYLAAALRRRTEQPLQDGRIFMEETGERAWVSYHELMTGWKYVDGPTESETVVDRIAWLAVAEATEPIPGVDPGVFRAGVRAVMAFLAANGPTTEEGIRSVLKALKAFAPTMVMAMEVISGTKKLTAHRASSETDESFGARIVDLIDRVLGIPLSRNDGVALLKARAHSAGLPTSAIDKFEWEGQEKELARLHAVLADEEQKHTNLQSAPLA